VQHRLGYICHTGRGAANDYAETTQWYTLATEKGNGNAQFNLGAMHYNGFRTAVAMAAKWWKSAAVQGDANAINNLPFALNFLFPPGSAVELVGLKAATLNGKRGVMVGTSAQDGGTPTPAVGKTMVRMDGNGWVQAAAFENVRRV
jgi:hypothetical protein